MFSQFDRDALITYMVLSECNKLASERHSTNERGKVPVEPGIVQRVWVLLRRMFTPKQVAIEPLGPDTHFLKDAIV